MGGSLRKEIATLNFTLMEIADAIWKAAKGRMSKENAEKTGPIEAIAAPTLKMALKENITV
ncbi:MAG: hypothetical protein QXH51_07050 [Candidatus Bathyarchaeia archaeon]